MTANARVPTTAPPVRDLSTAAPPATPATAEPTAISGNRLLVLKGVAIKVSGYRTFLKRFAKDADTCKAFAPISPNLPWNEPLAGAADYMRTDAQLKHGIRISDTEIAVGLRDLAPGVNVDKSYYLGSPDDIAVALQLFTQHCATLQP